MEIDELFGAAIKSVETQKGEEAQTGFDSSLSNAVKDKKSPFNAGIKTDLINLLTKYKYNINNQELQFVIASFLQQLSNF